MALDEALFTHVREPLLRIYRWRSPAVSFGYFGKYALVAAAWPGRELVRRMTGGGIVPHGEDITYTLVIPASDRLAQLSAGMGYRLIHAALAGWLAARGLSVLLAGKPVAPAGGLCFENAAEADVLDGGRKVAGAAQRRTRAGLLHQGSIQGVPLEWRDQLSGAFAARISRRDFSNPETRLAADLAREKYGAEAWNTRLS